MIGFLYRGSGIILTLIRPYLRIEIIVELLCRLSLAFKGILRRIGCSSNPFGIRRNIDPLFKGILLY